MTGGQVARSTAWVAIASAILGGLDLVSTLLCVRLWVSTADFGAATLAIALFPILDRLGGMGLGAALVREPEGEDSVFWLGLGASTTVLGALVAARALFGNAIGEPVVASLLAAYGARLVIMNVSMVPEARMRRALRFHELSIIRVIAGGAETATKLGLAYAGAHGTPELRVWCFGLGPIANTIVTALLVQLRCPWRPHARFDRATCARAARFTAALSGGELLYFAYTSADYLVVGAYFGHAAVGAYRLAYELVLDVVRLISMITAEVAYPVFVRIPRERIGAQLVAFTRQNLIVLAPFLVFVAIESGDLLRALYGVLPPEAATASRILCLVGALRALGFVVPPMLAALGEARRVLIYNAIACVALPCAFAIAGRLGSNFTAVAWAWAAGYPIAFAALLAMAMPRAHVTAGAYTRAIAGIALCAAIAGAAGLATDLALDQPVVVGAVVLGVYALALAAIEKVTPASVIRSFREGGSATAAPEPGTAPPPGT